MVDEDGGSDSGDTETDTDAEPIECPDGEVLDENDECVCDTGFDRLESGSCLCPEGQTFDDTGACVCAGTGSAPNLDGECCLFLTADDGSCCEGNETLNEGVCEPCPSLCDSLVEGVCTSVCLESQLCDETTAICEERCVEPEVWNAVSGACEVPSEGECADGEFSFRTVDGTETCMTYGEECDPLIRPWVAYVSNDVGDSGHLALERLWLVRSDGSEATYLGHELAQDADPSWSADGQKLVTVYTSGATQGLRVIDFSDGSERLVTVSGVSLFSSPAWSPVLGDERIVVQTRTEFDSPWELGILSLDTDTVTPLTSPPEGDEGVRGSSLDPIWVTRTGSTIPRTSMTRPTVALAEPLRWMSTASHPRPGSHSA